MSVDQEGPPAGAEAIGAGADGPAAGDPAPQPTAVTPLGTGTGRPSDRLRRAGSLLPPRRRESFTDRFDRSPTAWALRAPMLRFLLKLPLKKLTIWAAFLGLLYVLRDFFGLIFLTFVLSYITSTVVGRVSPYFSTRKVPVLLSFLLILGAVGGVGFAIARTALAEGQEIVRKMERIKDPKRFIDIQVGRALGGHPVVEGAAALQGGMLGAVYGDPHRRGDQQNLLSNLSERVADPAVGEALGEGLKGVQKELVAKLVALVAGIWKGVVTVFAALVFSFLIVWDSPRLATGLVKLKKSRLGDIWTEVAPSIATFARLLGKAFEAQTVIALCNTALTATGLWLLGIPGIGFLSLIVLVCSFIPVLGVFISTVPICMVALQVGGIGQALGAVIMVTGVHMMEAYVLNPRIYGYHLNMHPVAVLIVLYLGHHMFDVWGLIIGVPLSTYVWRHLIMGEAETLSGGVEAAAPGAGEAGADPAAPPPPAPVAAPPRLEEAPTVVP